MANWRVPSWMRQMETLLCVFWVFLFVIRGCKAKRLFPEMGIEGRQRWSAVDVDHCGKSRICMSRYVIRAVKKSKIGESVLQIWLFWC